jgi:hypothetical protein
MSDSATPPSTGHAAAAASRTPIVESPIQRIEKWFFDPLNNLGTNGCFITMLVAIPLYEKHLRHTTGQLHGEPFAQGGPLVAAIAVDLSITESEAFDFWQVFRNGLCHHCMPKDHNSWLYEFITDHSQAEAVIASTSAYCKIFRVNASAFLSIVKRKILSNPGIFLDPKYMLAIETT